MIDRRELLGATAASIALAGTARAGGSADDPFSADRLFADVTRYAGFGNHQTGSVGGIATGLWVRQRLEAARFTVGTLPIDVPFFEPRKVKLTVGDVRIDALAQHPVVMTMPAGLQAPLRMRYDAADDAELAGKIAVVPLPYGRHSAILSPAIAPALIAASKSGAVGMVVITTGPSGLPIALNAPEQSPLGKIPIVVIGLGQTTQLIAHARAGAQATLVIDGDSGRRRGDNLIARRPGPGAKVVVTTPLSGWFQCAGERGSGIAAWLAFAAWLPRAFPRHDFLFAGLVGHELENVGSKRFLAEVAPPPDGLALWHHFGSGFATRDWHEAGPGRLTPLPSADPQRYLLASPSLVPVVQRSTRGLPGFEKVYTGDAKTAVGEATNILAAGYDRLIANFAGHRFHHSQGDGPETTSGDLIASTTLAMRNAVAEILKA